MIDQLYIAQLEKQYISFLKSIVLDKPFSPVILRGGKNKPSTTVELHNIIRLFQANEKKHKTNGWVIEWEEWDSKKLGKQKWPSVITVATEEDFLYLIKKAEEVVGFKRQLEELLQWKPAIRNYLVNNPKLVLQLKGVWTGICKVVDYLLENDVTDHYLRSIPVPVHTKFIHQNKKIIYSILQFLDNRRFPTPEIDIEDALSLNKKPFLFLLRWLDDNLSVQLTAGMQFFAVPASYLQKQTWHIERVIIVENETNLYLLPSLPGSLVICSYGKALHLLKTIDLLHNTRLYYWGDLDEQGFIMLNDFRSYYSHVISLFMDAKTISCHTAELDHRILPYKRKELPLLHQHESNAYQYLLAHNQWLEQEKLQQDYVQQQIQELL